MPGRNLQHGRICDKCMRRSMFGGLLLSRWGNYVNWIWTMRRGILLSGWLNDGDWWKYRWPL